MSGPGNSRDGIVLGLPRVLLRIEGVVLFALTAVLYAQLGASWILFAVILLAPDAAMVGYLGGTRIGAVMYNLTHTYLGPGALVSIGVLGGAHQLSALALVWFAHIGMDRTLGYGLKYDDAFTHTHLGLIGSAARHDRRG
jgi:Domain of unknown function (DUF4260)